MKRHEEAKPFEKEKQSRKRSGRENNLPENAGEALGLPPMHGEGRTNEYAFCALPARTKSSAAIEKIGRRTGHSCLVFQAGFVFSYISSRGCFHRQKKFELEITNVE